MCAYNISLIVFGGYNYETITHPSIKLFTDQEQHLR